MNKLFTKIAVVSAGFALAIGVGAAALSRNSFATVKADDTTDVTYTISDYSAGTQYAENEEHVLDSILTLTSNGCHFTTQLRMYQDSDPRVNWVRLDSLKKITKVKMNINCNTKNQTNVISFKGSNDSGANYTDIGSFTTDSGTSFSDKTMDFGTGINYKTVLFKNEGSYQTRIKTITVTYLNEAAVVSGVTVTGNQNINSGYLGYTNVQLSADVQYSSGQGDESVNWSSSSLNNTVNANGIVHITANEETVITATSAEDNTKSGSITLHISGLLSRTFAEESLSINSTTVGDENKLSETKGTPAVIESGNISFSIDKADSSNNPGYYKSEPASIRLFTGSTLTVSSIDGNNMYFVRLISENAGYQLAPASATLDKGVFSIDENGVAMIDLSSVPASSVTLTIVSTVRFDLAKVYYLEQTDKEAVQDFVDTYMHMDDYTTEQGWCSDADHHYYSDAKAAFNALSDARRTLFTTDADFADAFTRLKAWAKANHDEFNETTHVLETNKMFATNENNVIILVVISVISAISLAGLAALLVLKKRKQY